MAILIFVTNTIIFNMQIKNAGSKIFPVYYIFFIFVFLSKIKILRIESLIICLVIMIQGPEHRTYLACILTMLCWVRLDAGQEEETGKSFTVLSFSQLPWENTGYYTDTQRKYMGRTQGRGKRGLWTKSLWLCFSHFSLLYPDSDPSL